MTTILLVEDDPQFMEHTHRNLSRAGYTVIKAWNGEEALDKLAKHQGQIDLVVSDEMMPKVTGPQLAAKMAANPILKHIPVIFYSSMLVFCRLPNVKSCLSKGRSTQELLDVIEETINRRA